MLIKKTFLIIIGVILFPTIATAESASFPTIRGDYLVCPNGKTIPKNYWSNLLTGTSDYDPQDLYFANNTWGRKLYKRKNLSKISMITSELLVGKKAKDMPQEAIEKLKEKMLWGGIKTPNAYKSYDYSIGPTYVEQFSNQQMRETDTVYHWNYGMKNSEGKSIKIKRKVGGSISVIDNDGKVFKVESSNQRVLGLIYCRPNSINLRVVRALKLQDITNDYGEQIKLPLMFLKVEIGIKSDSPKNENKYSF